MMSYCTFTRNNFFVLLYQKLSFAAQPYPTVFSVRGIRGFGRRGLCGGMHPTAGRSRRERRDSPPSPMSCAGASHPKFAALPLVLTDAFHASDLLPPKMRIRFGAILNQTTAKRLKVYAKSCHQLRKFCRKKDNPQIAKQALKSHFFQIPPRIHFPE
jgi:hypothetical protein